MRKSEIKQTWGYPQLPGIKHMQDEPSWNFCLHMLESREQANKIEGCQKKHNTRGWQRLVVLHSSKKSRFQYLRVGTWLTFIGKVQENNQGEQQRHWLRCREERGRHPNLLAFKNGRAHGPRRVSDLKGYLGWRSTRSVWSSVVAFTKKPAGGGGVQLRIATTQLEKRTTSAATLSFF